MHFGFSSHRTQPPSFSRKSLSMGFRPTTPATRRRRLIDLPDQILFTIMRLLDPKSIQCLRRASRVFLSIFSDPSLSHWHRDPSAIHPRYPRLLWARGSPEFETESYTEAFRNLLAADQSKNICYACRVTEDQNPKKVWIWSTSTCFVQRVWSTILGLSSLLRSEKEIIKPPKRT